MKALNYFISLAMLFVFAACSGGSPSLRKEVEAIRKERVLYLNSNYQEEQKLYFIKDNEEEQVWTVITNKESILEIFDEKDTFSKESIWSFTMTNQTDTIAIGWQVTISNGELWDDVSFLFNDFNRFLPDSWNIPTFTLEPPFELGGDEICLYRDENLWCVMKKEIGIVRFYHDTHTWVLKQ